jgi:hypothetical protein
VLGSLNDGVGRYVRIEPDGILCIFGKFSFSEFSLDGAEFYVGN